MFEQVIASIIKFVLDNSDEVTPYYYRVPENFIVPAVYFPVPFVDTRSGTYSSYIKNYNFNILFFDSSSNLAYCKATKVLELLNSNRNKVPIVDKDGQNTGKTVRINEMSITNGDNEVVLLKLNFDMHLPYKEDTETKVQEFFINAFYKEKLLTADEIKQIENFL